MKSLLLIEDSFFMDLMKSILHRYELVEAGNIASAFMRLRERADSGLGRFSLIILDLGLPDSEPEESVKRIPDLIRAGDGARVLVVTAHEELFDALNIRGCVGMLAKLDPQFRAKITDLVDDLTA